MALSQPNHLGQFVNLTNTIFHLGVIIFKIGKISKVSL
uniref:Uncharacterized protein n=1 Tax=Anguilla anguilla TaxID=7936 RepID=A0A0E9TGF0_ANGAN